MAVRLHGVETGEGPPLLILHGLFGSARNWGGAARRLGERWRVHALDLRNHGASPWDSAMAYEDIADDVQAYIRERSLAPCLILGHSMGGKAAMLLALRSPALVERLVVVDIAPVVYGHSHLPLIEAMRSIDLGTAARRADVDAALRERIPDDALRLFLLQNLATRDGRLVWRINLDALAANMDRLLGFPELAAETIFEHPTLFVAGELSDYLGAQRRPAVLRRFPAARFAVIPGAGHWVHAEQPDAFLRVVERFLGE